ncbi:MAG: cysteine desulfurase [Proteobacteria bacterium]|nr:cysteine desulfurase [Pseudomonadota bacterium]
MNIELIRAQFPILKQMVHGYPLAYLDNAATTQKPQVVIDALQNYYLSQNANVHRGAYYLSELATALYEKSRVAVQQFIHAAHTHECIFVRGVTEGINLVANGFAREILHPGDEILVSQIEHHANIVPWQLACHYTNAKLQVIPCNDRGELDIEAYKQLLNTKTKLVAITHVSNALGTINPIQEMIALAHHNNTPVLIDGAQAISHLQVNVQALDCDFYTFSAHKMYGPLGIGILYGKSAWLEKLPPFEGGGEMIKSVTFGKTLYNDLPYKFEAGTMPIAEIISLSAAIHFINEVGYQNILSHEKALLDYALEKLATVEDLRFIGIAKQRAPVISFLLGDIHPHDVGTVLDHAGIAVRTGKHCAEPTMDRFNVNATVRASFAIYNTVDEIDRLVVALAHVNKVFKR